MKVVLCMHDEQRAVASDPYWAGWEPRTAMPNLLDGVRDLEAYAVTKGAAVRIDSGRLSRSLLTLEHSRRKAWVSSGESK